MVVSHWACTSARVRMVSNPQVLVTLITSDVHQRDVVDGLIARRVTSASDFRCGPRPPWDCPVLPFPAVCNPARTACRSRQSSRCTALRCAALRVTRFPGRPRRPSRCPRSTTHAPYLPSLPRLPHLLSPRSWQMQLRYEYEAALSAPAPGVPAALTTDGAAAAGPAAVAPTPTAATAGGGGPIPHDEIVVRQVNAR